jgi:hypothetical protein
LTSYRCRDTRIGYTQDPNLFLDLLKSKFPRRSFMKIFTRSNSSEDLRWISSETLGKIFRRKDFKKIWIKTFSSKILQKIFKQFLAKFFLGSLDLWNLWKIFVSNLLEIFERSSIKIFLRSSDDLLAFFLILNLKKFVKQLKMVRRSSYIIFRQSSCKS